jgi:hypothetical protein
MSTISYKDFLKELQSIGLESFFRQEASNNAQSKLHHHPVNFHQSRPVVFKGIVRMFNYFLRAFYL